MSSGRMQVWIGSRRALVLVIAGALLLAVPSLGGGFVTDDHAFRAVLHAGARSAWDLFSFQRGDPAENAQMVRYGRLVWWAASDLKIHFLRPLTGFLFALDDRVWGDAALGYHLHSLLWFAVLLGGVAVLYRRLLAPAAAILGVAAFGLAAAHTQAFAWPSARHALLGGAGAAWALALYARSGRSRWFGLAPLALGLAASEAALGAVPLWAALAACREGSWRARLGECLPPTALGLAYLVTYHALGCGARASGGYHDPLADPFGFARLALLRIPILLGDAALAIPAELSLVHSPFVLALCGLVAAGLVALAWCMTGPHASETGWLALGGLVALLPGVAGYPTGRVLLVPDLAFAALIGSILSRGLFAPGAGSFLAAGLAAARLLWSPLLELHDQRRLAERGRFAEGVAHEARELVPRGGRAIIVAAADPLAFLYPRGVLAATARGAVRCWSVLSAARGRHRLTKISDHELELVPLDQPLLDGTFDTLFRAPDRPFAIGDAVDQCGAQIRVAAIERGLPSRLQIRYVRRLDDPELTFLAWRNHQLEPLGLPSVGQSIELPGTSR